MMRDLVFQFGGLLFWPIARIVDRDRRRLNEILRGIFTMHIVAGFLVLAASILVTILGLHYWLPTFKYLRYIGLISIAASLITLSIRRREQPEDY